MTTEVAKDAAIGGIGSAEVFVDSVSSQDSEMSGPGMKDSFVDEQAKDLEAPEESPKFEANSIQQAPYMQQLEVALIKNALLLSRRPLQVMIMITCTIGSVLLSYVVAYNNQGRVDFSEVPLTKCGVVEQSFIDSIPEYHMRGEVPNSFNQNWGDGLALTVMALGPMFHSVFVFVTVQVEIQTQMLGILRGAGIRESVFWLSWWIPFGITSFLNALAGGITASALSLHAFENIYFLGIFASFFFLNLALVGGSFLIAAACGTTRGGAATWCVVIILAAQWSIYLHQLITMEFVYSAMDSNGNINTYESLFWTNKQTKSQYEGCERPILSKARGSVFTPLEWIPGDDMFSGWGTHVIPDYDFPEDELFVGCYFGAGYSTEWWNKDKVFGNMILFFFPYVHFTGIWSNFLGYTGMPDRTFGFEQASMSPEELARASFPGPIPEDNRTSLFPQGTMLAVETNTDSYSDWRSRTTNCPPDTSFASLCDPGWSSCASVAGQSPTSSPSVHALMMLLVFLSFLYTLLAAYITQVRPGRNGAPRKPYFFLLPSYWFGSKKERNEQLAATINVLDARKAYGSFEALKGVTMTMSRGEVTALLGHNGAGKTTLSHILCCEIDASDGDAFVSGHSVTDDPDSVRQLVAVCKQDDYLYPDLTAREHLECFAGLRGVPMEEIPEMVQKWLESVDLAIVQNQYSSSFSGGMKRRLSLACATIGGRPLIILDEPTTGMDPLSRRAVWRHIDEIKEDRVVLLTTHAMEEADLLADSVAIMRKGDLAAYGTPLELKAKYGSAFQFSMLVDQQDVRGAQDGIIEHFQKELKHIALEVGEAGNISVKIDKIKKGDDGEGVGVESLTSFVSWLCDEDVSKVKEWGFSNSSLEEVFLTVSAAEDEEKPMHDIVDDYDVCCGGCSRTVLRCCLRSCCRCCCCPTRRVREEPDQAEVDAVNMKTDMNNLASFEPVLSVPQQVQAIIYFSFSRHWVGKTSGWIFHLILVGLSLFMVVRAVTSGFPVPFMAGPTCLLGLPLITLVSPIYRDRSTGVFYLMRAQGLRKASHLIGYGLYSFSYQFIFSLITLSVMYTCGLYHAPPSCIDDFCDQWIIWSWKRLGTAWQEIDVGDSEVQVNATWQAGGYHLIIATALAFALTTPGAVFTSSYIPGFRLAMVVVATFCLVAGILPIILYFLIAPRYSEQCVLDVCDFATPVDQLGGQEMLNCIGIQINEISGLCLPKRAALFPQVGLFHMLVTTLMANIRFESNPPEYVNEVFIPSLGDRVKCNGNVCEFPFARERFGSYMFYTIVGGAILMAIGFCFVSFFSFPDGVTRNIRNSISTIYNSMTLDVVKPKKKQGESGTDTHVPLEEVVEESSQVEAAARAWFKFESNFSDEHGDGSQILSDMQLIDPGMRDSVAPLLSYKLRKVYPSLGGVPPKTALHSLDLQVPKGQVLGLLGQNGAGKTTALKIWACAHSGTSGLASVGGYNVSTEKLSVYERLGNCPQFDIICPTESVKRHLEFFALLKGLPMSEVQHLAHSIASSVGLGLPSVYNRHAGRLSGGMRRRLSIAISLIGAPTVLLLDEPTTGLDPSTRNSIWNLINSFSTTNRAVVITTHMMLEADTLCNRIAIMSKGHLKVIGTQQTLKDRFGSGYLLQLNLTKSNEENQRRALDFVRSRVSPDAILQTRQAKTLRVALPRDVHLPDVFSVLYGEDAATEGCINQFLLSQSSLEDVFIALGGD